MKKAVHSFRENVWLTLGMGLFGVLVLLAFVAYSGFQNQQFEYMESQNQTALVLWQSQKVQTELARIEGQLRAISDMIAASGAAPENEWFQTYLSQLDVNDQYHVEYRSHWRMEQEMENGTAPQEIINGYSQLLNGKQVISDIQFYQEFSDYYFMIEEPVENFGKTIGSIRCMIPASSLVQQDAADPFPCPEGQYIVDSRGKVYYSSGPMDLTGQNLLDGLTHVSVPSQDLEAVSQALESGRNAAVFLKEKDGTYIMTCASLNYRGWNLVQFVPNGHLRSISKNLLRGTILLGFVFVVMTGGAAYMVYDMIGRKNLHLEYERANYQSLARVLNAVLFEYCPKTGKMSLSLNAAELLDISDCEIEDIRKQPFEAVFPDDMDDFYRLLENDETGVMEIRLRTKNGEWMWYECQVQPTLPGDQSGILTGRIININSRKMRELRLEKESTADPLTGLMNRTAVRSAVERIWKMSPKGFLFMFDIDDFKGINDTKGHMAGDHVLCGVAEVLKRSFRGHDPVGRFGGDEFLAYMADCDSREQAASKAEFILGKLSELSEKEQIRVSLSIGIAAAPKDGGEFDVLYKKADAALYQAKQQGKTCYSFYSQEGQLRIAEGNQTDE